MTELVIDYMYAIKGFTVIFAEVVTLVVSGLIDNYTFNTLFQIFLILSVSVIISINNNKALITIIKNPLKFKIINDSVSIIDFNRAPHEPKNYRRPIVENAQLIIISFNPICPLILL